MNRSSLSCIAVLLLWQASAQCAPPPADFAIRTASEQEILANSGTQLGVFRFARNQEIVVLDFPSLRAQGRMLNRMAALVEKAGTPHDRVLADGKLEQAIRASGQTDETYYYGHDYAASDLARFFMLADRDRVTLNADEERLRGLVRLLGWFAPASNGGLISIAHESGDATITRAARAVFLEHELSHGEWFTDPDYRAYVLRFWRSALTDEERDGLRRYLRQADYDTRIDALMANEMQAYLMFTTDPGFFRPDKAGFGPARLIVLQTAFLQDMPKSWLREELERHLTPH